MFTVVFLIITIALAVSIASATITYLPFDRLLEVKALNQLEDDIKVLDRGVLRYYADSAHRGEVNLVPDRPLWPGLDVDMAPLLSPHYGFVPPGPDRVEWVVRAGDYQGQQAIYFCLQPTDSGNDAVTAVLPRIAARQPKDSTFLSNACGATADHPLVKTHLTRWILLSHLD